MKLFWHLIIIAIISMMTMSVFAEEHQLGAHVHGVATMQVTVDTSILTLNFSSPLDNLLGFEHPSRNQAEVAQVQNMINAFYKTNLFVPTPAAQCRLKTIDLQSLVIKKRANSPKPQHEEPAGHAGHTDLDAGLVYQCQQVKQLRDLQVNLFKTFPNLHQLNVEVVSSQGQTAAKLTSANSQIIW